MEVRDAKPYATPEDYLEGIVAFWWARSRAEGVTQQAFRAQLDP